MFKKAAQLVLPLAATLVFTAPIAGFGQDMDTFENDAKAKVEAVKEGAEGVVETAGYALEMLQLSTESCEDVIAMSVREGEGHGVPGVSGDERWGIPEAAPDTPRVRRSWSTLSDEEKKQVVDGFVSRPPATRGGSRSLDRRGTRGSIFNFSEVRADEMFDFRALGFTYDSNE